MSIVYFDSSALVKLLVDEVGTDLVVALWDSCDVPVSSPLADAEVCAALGSLARNHAFSPQRLHSIVRRWDGYWAAIRRVHLTDAVAHNAGQLAIQRKLRGADALHLASAMTLGPYATIFAVFDKQLHAAAEAEHFGLAPVTI